MPICEIDPWRAQYFEKVDCPADVFIPTEDSDAWLWNPEHRWVYDKLAVAIRQGFEAAPHGVAPKAFPVFSKPIYNLKGMGVGSRALRSPADYEAAYRPGHMWMPLLQGDHVSSDVALVDGVPSWWRHARGVPGDDGTFDYWEIGAGSEHAIERWAADWCQRHFAGYTGMVNFETIGGRIIGCTCGLPTNGRISTARDGWKRSCGSMPGASGAMRMATGAPATAWCCSCRTAVSTAIRRRPSCSA